MTYLVAGLVMFFGVHVIPMLPKLKASLEDRFGALRFKGIFSIVSLAGFILIVTGMSLAAFRPLFTPPNWAAQAARLAMPVAFCLLVAAYLPNNFRRVIRHPMLSGVLLWALAHFAANGDLASVLLFGSFAAYSIVDMVSASSRSEARAVARQHVGMDVLVLVIGFAAFWIVRHFHAPLFGVAV